MSSACFACKNAISEQRRQKTYESGEIYYLKSDKEKISLMDYVLDDMRDIDAQITGAPKTPSYPSWWEYSTTEAYDAAVAQYEIDYEIYKEESKKYGEKLERDELRERLSNITIERSSYTLYYWNGTEEKILTDAFINDYTYEAAKNKPVIVFGVYNQPSFNKIKLSGITDVYDVEQKVNSSLFSSTDRYISVGGSAAIIEQNSAKNFYIDDDGQTIFFIDNIPENKEYGELYKIVVSNGKVQKPELYDSDVYKYGADFIDNGKFMYYKDVYDKISCDLYINKERIDYDVYINSVKYDKNSGRILYLTDWNNNKYYGTLKEYADGKAAKIRDDVFKFDIAPDGGILYLCDYSTKYYKGDLFVYKNGKAEKIDDEVITIIPVPDREDLLNGIMYY